MKLQYIVCPICSSAKASVYLKNISLNLNNTKNINNFFNIDHNFKPFRTVKCSRCSHIYANPTFKSKVITNFYKKNLVSSYMSQNKARIETFIDSLKYLEKFLKSKKKEGEGVGLDVGTGDGAWLKVLHNNKILCEGIEPNYKLINYAKYRRLKVFNTDLHSFKSTKKYDFITMWDSLEHMQDLKTVKYKITKLLKKGGILIICTPDHESIIRKILKGHWPYYSSQHLHYFNTSLLKRFLSNDFKFLSKKKHYQILELGYIINIMINKYCYFKYLKKIFFFLSINKIRIKYYLGQKIFVFRKII